MICDETLAGKVGQQLPRVLAQKTADVAKEIDRLGPTRTGERQRNILLDRAVRQHSGKNTRALRRLTHHDV